MIDTDEEESWKAISTVPAKVSLMSQRAKLYAAHNVTVPPFEVNIAPVLDERHHVDYKRDDSHTFAPFIDGLGKDPLMCAHCGLVESDERAHGRNLSKYHVDYKPDLSWTCVCGKIHKRAIDICSHCGRVAPSPIEPLSAQRPNGQNPVPVGYLPPSEPCYHGRIDNCPMCEAENDSNI